MRHRLVSDNKNLESFLTDVNAELIGIEKSEGHDVLMEVLGLGLRTLFQIKNVHIHNFMVMLRKTCSLVHADMDYFARYMAYSKNNRDINDVNEYFEEYYLQTFHHKKKDLASYPTSIIMLSVLSKYIPVSLFVYLEDLPANSSKRLRVDIETRPLINLTCMSILFDRKPEDAHRPLYLIKLDDVAPLFNTQQALILVYNKGAWSFIKQRQEISVSPSFIQMGDRL